MKYLKYLVSMSFTGVLLLVFAVSIGTATFIENDFGPVGSQAVVYKALWFELLLLWLTINMITTVFTNKLYLKEKWPNLTFHLAFIIILIGAGITRFFGVEGIMHIREGESSSSIVSDATYISATILAGEEKESFNKKVLFTPVKKSRFSQNVSIGNNEAKLKLISFIQNATQIVENDPENGVPTITLVIAGRNGRENKYLTQGNSINVRGIRVGFDVEDGSALQFVHTDEGLKFMSSQVIKTLSMDTRLEGQIEADSVVDAPFRHLLTIGETNFVLGAFNPTGTVKIVSAPTEQGAASLDAVVMSVEAGNTYEELILFGGRGIVGNPQFVQMGELNLKLAYGAIRMDVPFAVQLRDFELERYPGSDSPSSYASEVTVLDGETHFPFRIYMNNILSYKGYRLYQSSYDKDEKGTILSVNKDRAGTYVTYFGYLMLAIGLIWVLFSKDTRFAQLSRLIDSIHHKREKMVSILIGLFVLTAVAANAQAPQPVPLDQAAKVGRLVYQTNDGRMAPLNTLANDLLRKVYKQTTFEGQTADQVMLGMMSDPYAWQQVKMIEVKAKEVKKLLGMGDEKYMSFTDFFAEGTGVYRLKDEVNAAYTKQPAQRGTIDKELIKVDERVNICYLIYQGYLLKIFPVPGDTTHNHWVTPVDDDLHGMHGNDSSFVRNAALEYMRSIKENNLEQANYILDGIKLYQSKYGSAVMPSENKLDLEIKFNSWNIFKRLYSFYMLTGFILLILLFIRILNTRVKLRMIVGGTVILIFLGFLVHTSGLIIRWYISGHEPWSNGYESMIYIAWTGLLAGFVFRKKSIMTLAVTAILGGIILWVANMSWMDPEITNLVPVLKSYWLTIHVATIVASYGFLGLGALLAFTNLLTMIMQTEKNKLRLGLSIKELTYVIEMTLVVGLILLTIGNFLGGIWANESWGRYWGWDPKETWAMATIIFYAFVLHMRLIPGLKSTFTFNFASLIAFASVLMTYFGVNFYLSGLHSYAAGDPVPIPTFVYYTLAVVAIVSTWAYFNANRLKTQQVVSEAEQADNQN